MQPKRTNFRLTFCVSSVKWFDLSDLNQVMVAELNYFLSKLIWLGVHGARVTPVPIPNTAVKPGIGYNTAA